MKDIIVDTPYPDVKGVNKYEVSLGIASMLKKGRQYFGSAGASLSHHVNNPDYTSEFKAKVVSIGFEGERSTTLILKEWLKDKPTAILLDSVHIKGMGKEEIDEETGMVEGGDTDHVLIVGSNVILIDTKRWRAGWMYSVNPKGKVIRGKQEFAGGRNLHAKQAKYMWKQYLHESAKVSSIVVINSKDVKVRRDANWKKQAYRLTTIQDLLNDLDYRYERFDEIDKTNINSTLVTQVAMCCIKPYDAYTKVFDMNAIKDFK